MATTGVATNACVVRTLYRRLLNLSRSFDKDPLLKACLPSYRHRLYELRTSSYIGVPRVHRDKEDAAMKALRAIMVSVCGRHALYYRPMTTSTSSADGAASLQSMVKTYFRHCHPVIMESLISGNTVSKGSISFPADADSKRVSDQRVELAFVAMRYLSLCRSIVSPFRDDETPPVPDTTNEKVAQDGGRSSENNSSGFPVFQLESLRNRTKIGSLLLSHPLHVQSNLLQSVMLIGRHDDIKGSIGYELNHYTGYDMEHFLVEDAYLKQPLMKHIKSIPTFFGGPMNLGTAILVHNSPYLAFCSDKIYLPTPVRNATDVDGAASEAASEAVVDNLSTDGKLSKTRGRKQTRYVPQRSMSERQSTLGQYNPQHHGSKQNEDAKASFYVTSNLDEVCKVIQGGHVKPEECRVSLAPTKSVYIFC
jgi:Uncharacterized ACR, COG1678